VDFLVPSAYWAPVPPNRLIHSFIPVSADPGTTTRPSLDTKSSLLPPINPVDTATRKPAPINYVFALDVSLEAAQGGFLRSACDILLDILYGDRLAGGTVEADAATVQPSKRSWWNPESKLAIVTYDRELCFYDLSVRSTKHAFITL
jgi:protein transport protein SEC24